MRRYERYKPSLNCFLDAVPSHWEEKPIKAYCRIKCIQNVSSEELLSVFLNYGVVRYCETDQQQVHKPSEDLSQYQLVEPGDLVLNNQQAWRGSVGISKYRGIVSPAYFVLSVDSSLNSQFVNYMVRYGACVPQFVIASKGVGSIQRILNPGKLLNSIFSIPPRPEQDQIVRYLDWQVSRIDRLIEGKKRELELLITQEENLIATVVTSGIRREKKKQCDLIWLKSKPESWKTVKIKRVFRERVEKGFPKEPLLAATQNMGVVPKEVYGERTVEATKDLHLLKLVRVGDFVISLRSFQGGIEYAYYQGIISPAYTIMIPSEQIFPGFFRLLAKSKPFIELLKLCVTGIREGQNIDYDRLKNSLIPLPTLEEQKEIAEYLDQQSKKINTLREKLLKEVENLQEFKTRLISDVVTGKIDVSAYRTRY